MFHFVGKSSELLPVVNTRLRLLSLLVLVLISLCMGCAMTPSVSRKDLPLSSHIQKFPLKAIVVFPKKFQDAMPGGFHFVGITAQVGKSSVELFKEVLPLLFQEVEFVTEDITPEHYQILIIPEIVEAYIGQRTGRFEDWPCVVEYKISFFDLDHKMIFQASAYGSGPFDSLCTFKWPAAELSKAFAKAEAQAMSELIDNIISSPELLAYADGIKGRITEHKPEKGAQKVATPQYPPMLVCKVKFSEPSGNYLLDAEEEGKLLVTIENKGKGNANLIQIDLNTIEPVKGLSYNKRLFIKTVPAGKSIYKEIPLKADKTIPTSQVKFKVQAMEIGGFDSEPVIAVFKTREFQPSIISDISDDAKQKQKEIADYSTHSAAALPMPKPTRPGTPSSQISVSQRWAVVIGVSSYEDTRISSLRYASSDARAFYEWLISPTGGKYAPSNVKCLLDKNATAKNIKNALFVWLKQAIQEDIVTIFFACHGSPESPDSLNNLFLLPYDAKYDEIATSGFPMWDLETALKRFIKARKVVIIADACHSGGIGQSFDIARRANRGIKVNPINSELQSLSKVGDGVCVISASDEKQFSQESQKWGGGHGVFTYFLLKGLKGEADYSNDKRVTLGELIPYLSEQVRRTTKSAQCPTVAGKFDPALTIGR